MSDKLFKHIDLSLGSILLLLQVLNVPQNGEILAQVFNGGQIKVDIFKLQASKVSRVSPIAKAADLVPRQADVFSRKISEG